MTDTINEPLTHICFRLDSHNISTNNYLFKVNNNEMSEQGVITDVNMVSLSPIPNVASNHAPGPPPLTLIKKLVDKQKTCSKWIVETI